MKFTSLTLAALVTAVTAPAVFAQSTYKKDMPDSLVKRAKITEAAASATAQKRVPKGTIAGVELEMENGKLMYSYDVKTEGKSGVDEVNIDALTGKIIGFAHESAATEQKEAAAEAKAARAAKPKKP